MLLLNMDEAAMEQVILPRKWKKTRRGKKKKPFDRQKEVDMIMTCACTGGAEDNLLSSMGTVYEHDAHQSQQKMKRGCKLVRPFNSPRAPHNSTQFIIDDRLGPNHQPIIILPMKKDVDPVSSHGGSGFYDDLYHNIDLPVTVSDQCLSPDGRPISSPDLTWKTSPAYSDVDYKYKAYPDVEDFLTFQQQDFEQEFQLVREKALLNRSKSELVTDITDLRGTINTLQQQLKCCSVGKQQNESSEMKSKDCERDFAGMNELETQLIKLQKTNELLKALNNSLKPVSSYQHTLKIQF